MHYNRLVALVLAANVGCAVYGASVAGWWISSGTYLRAVALVAQANLFVAVVFRQQYIVNALAWLVTRPSTSWPLRVRWTLGKYYHYGGVHVGAAVAGTLWYLTLVVSLIRDSVVGVRAFSHANLILAITIVTVFAVMIVMALPRLPRGTTDSK